MDQNNLQPQNILPPLEPLVWGVPVIRSRVPIHVRNRFLQER